MTRQRRVILEELAKVHSHPTADELYARVRRRLPRISLGTVYRNLDLLTKAGDVRKLAAGRQRRFDGDTSRHYHVRCTGCGAVADLEVEAPDGVEEAARRASDYEITGHEIVFSGRCPRCRARGGRAKQRSDP